MSSDPDRLRRLRDQQIAARDPLVHQRQLDHRIAQRQRRARTSFSVLKMWSQTPRRWRGLLLGVLTGATLLLVLPLAIESTWTAPCAGVATLFLAFLGFLIGRAMDSRHDLHDLLR